MYNILQCVDIISASKPLLHIDVLADDHVAVAARSEAPRCLGRILIIIAAPPLSNLLMIAAGSPLEVVGVGLGALAPPLTATSSPAIGRISAIIVRVSSSSELCTRI